MGKIRQLSKKKIWRQHLARTLQGNNYSWQLSDAPIGSGDAGEVFAATCIEDSTLIGILKKPARVASTGTIRRQAGQIAQEAQALKNLDGLPGGKAHPPKLIDTAPDHTLDTANYFFVSETAPGQNLDTLLTQARQAGKPFPHRVIITVLDALFDLFSRAHEAGILWNDVKLDHIYWHNLSGSVTVIDWGNALFLDRQNNGLLQTQPRWEDYQQMVESLSQFLQRSAPELYSDLGWEEFEGKILDATTISVLARRISFQQEVIALNVMEHQALIRVIISKKPSFTGLQKIQQYQQVLEKIGAPWDQDSVMEYIKSLVRTSFKDGDKNTGVRATRLSWELFGESLDLPWHLLREYFRNQNLLTHPDIDSLVKHTLAEAWQQALWTLTTIAKDVHQPTWWRTIAPVLRQKATGVATPSPYQAAQMLDKWVIDQNEIPTEITQQLSAMLKNWHTKGCDEPVNPLEYELLDLIRSDPLLPKKLSSQIKSSFSAGDEAIRNLYQDWMQLDWDQLPKRLRGVLSWDPDRWGILQVANEINQLQEWQQKLRKGPSQDQDPKRFLEEMRANRPQVEGYLGMPASLHRLVKSLDELLVSSPPADHSSVIKEWCPWLVEQNNLSFDRTGENKKLKY